MTDLAEPGVYRARDGFVHRKNYRRLGLTRISHGVYARDWQRAEPKPWELARAEALALARAIVALYPALEVVPYGPTGLMGWGVALPERFQSASCEVLVARGTRRPRRKGLVTHQTSAPLQVFRYRDELPLLHPVDYLLQLDGATQADLVEVGDGLMRRQQPLVGVAEFDARLAELAGVTGVKRVRAAVRWMVPGTDSLYETRTRQLLIRHGFPVPAVNHPVFCTASGRTYHIDMAFVAEQVGVEYDGLVHIGDRRQMEIDARRRRDLEREGWLIFVVTSAMLRDPTELLAALEAALILRRARWQA